MAPGRYPVVVEQLPWNDERQTCRGHDPLADYHLDATPERCILLDASVGTVGARHAVPLPPHRRQPTSDLPVVDLVALQHKDHI